MKVVLITLVMLVVMMSLAATNPITIGETDINIINQLRKNDIQYSTKFKSHNQKTITIPTHDFYNIKMIDFIH